MGRAAIETKVVNVRDLPEGWRDDPGFVYIGRARWGLDGYFGNPFRVRREAEREGALREFESYARGRLAEDPEYRERVAGLLGKSLVCFCKPKACHGDVLALLAAELAVDFAGDYQTR